MHCWTSQQWHPSRREQPGQRLARVRTAVLYNFLRRAGRDDPAALLTPFGPKVDDPVGRLDHLEIVLHHEHGVAGVDEIVQHGQKHLHVGEVEAGRGLVERVERSAGASLDQLPGELDSLGLAAGERRRRLADLDVVEPHVVQCLELVVDLRDVLEMGQGLLDVHFEDLGDRAALELDLEGLVVEAVAAADRAGNPNVGQEVHLQLGRAVAVAGLAPPAGHVEAEPPRLVAAGLGLWKLGVETPDLVERLDVGARVAPRRASDGRLVDGDHLVEVLEPFDRLVCARPSEAAVQITAQRLDEDVGHQRAFARARHAGHADEGSQRNLDVDRLKVIVPGAADDELLLADGPSPGRDGNLSPPGEIIAGDAFRLVHDLLG